MSALGQQLPRQSLPGAAALPPESAATVADECVRFGPKAGIRKISKPIALLWRTTRVDCCSGSLPSYRRKLDRGLHQLCYHRQMKISFAPDSGHAGLDRKRGSRGAPTKDEHAYENDHVFGHTMDRLLSDCLRGGWLGCRSVGSLGDCSRSLHCRGDEKC
jgi:hypothetical protein